MRKCHLVLRSTPDEGRAEVFRKRVLDVTVFLTRLGLREKPTGPGRPQRIAYHDACHLANAQNVCRDEFNLMMGDEILQCLAGDAHAVAIGLRMSADPQEAQL